METAFPKNKEEAVRRLKEEAFQFQPDQDFEVCVMQPEDAWGVARCFYEVYGEHYPFDTFYIPEKLIEANRLGDMIGVVARTAGGDIIGFGSFFRNFAHNPRLYETGQATVIPEYRATLAALCIQDYLFNTIATTVEIDAIFGEPVCNHLVMQQISSISGFADTGIELGLMPGETYQRGGASSSRISTVLSFKVLRDTPGEVYLPVEYEAVLRSIISKIPLSRDARVCSSPIPKGAASKMITRYFDQAQVLRISLCALGEDLEERLAEEESREREIAVCQIFLNLGEPWSGRAIAHLRNQGFFFGGFLPQWFETDGLLMQKLSSLPDFTSVNLLQEDTRKLFEFIKNDIGGGPTRWGTHKRKGGE